MGGRRWSGRSTRRTNWGSCGRMSCGKALDEHAGEPGVGRLREILDRRTFRYTRSELERVFIPLARQAGLPMPLTSVDVNGHEVDFYFPDLELVVETDGLTYHRTPPSRQRTTNAIRTTPPPASPRCGSPTPRSNTSPTASSAVLRGARPPGSAPSALPIGSRGERTGQRPRGQTQTALVSIGAAVLLVALKLGTGIATGSPGAGLGRDRVERRRRRGDPDAGRDPARRAARPTASIPTGTGGRRTWRRSARRRSSAAVAPSS